MSLSNSMDEMDLQDSSPVSQFSSQNLQLIGQSSNSFVFSLKNNSSIVLKSTLHSSQSQHSAECSHLINEFNILSKCSHSNIISLGSSNSSLCCGTQIKEKSCCSLLLERADCDLLKLLSSVFPNVLELKFLRYIFFKIASALNYLHIKMLVAHNDIKLENILMFGSEPKLADFGQSCSHQKDGVKQAQQYTHRSKKNLSPEINANIGKLNQLKSGQIEYQDIHAFDERKADSFAFGVALFNALIHCNPFEKAAQYDDKLYSQIGKEQFWENPKISQMLNFLNSFENANLPELKILLVSLLHPNPAMRISMKEAVQSPWFLKK